MDIFLKNDHDEDISLTNDGKLSLLDDTKLTNLNNFLINYKKNIFYNNIAYQRKKGNCYIFSSSNYFSAQNKDIFELFNNSSSNKNIYIYKIYITISNNNTQSNFCTLGINKITTASTGGTTNYGNTCNLKLDGTQLDSSSNVVIKFFPSGVGTKTKLYDYRFRITNTTNYDLFNFNKNQEEMIQIPPGYGLNIDFNYQSAVNLTSYITTTVKFMVLDNNDNYPEYNYNNITL